MIKLDDGIRDFYVEVMSVLVDGVVVAGCVMVWNGASLGWREVVCL